MLGQRQPLWRAWGVSLGQRLVCRLRGHTWAYLRTTPEGKLFRCRRCALMYQPPGAVWRE